MQADESKQVEEFTACVVQLRTHVTHLPGGVRKNFSLLNAMATLEKIARERGLFAERAS